MIGFICIKQLPCCTASNAGEKPSYFSVKQDSVKLVRGPYLQLGTPNGITILWRTDSVTNSRVRYGTNPNDLFLLVDDSELTTEHEIRLFDLESSKKYFYSVGSNSDTLAMGLNYFFLTAPEYGSKIKSRIWVLGDAGTANENQQTVRDAYYEFTDTIHTNLWVMLGDNAYNSGTDDEYQAAVFDMYPDMLRKSVLWPAFGNHDGRSASSLSQTGVFYNIFTLPANGEAGGIASDTEAYYSFDYANIHFICLNSHDISRSVTGPMLNWLKRDLDSNNRDWTIAFWHHPPYSKGSHDSDIENNLIEMRSNALPILENGGVDLILTGHSHSYERSFLLDGHYGNSSTLTSEMIIDGGDGQIDGDSAYQKSTLGPASHEGTVYIVAGSSGKVSGGSLDHPIMHISLNVLGSVILDVDSNRVDVTFLDHSGLQQDYFTLIKGEVDIPVSIEFPNMVTYGLDLLQIYPNPFVKETLISYSVPNLKFVRLKIFDSFGKEIQSMVNNFQQKGTYSVRFNGNKLSGGTYYLKLQIGRSYMEIRKIVLIN